MGKKKTQEEFEKEIREITNGKLEVIGTYTTMKKKCKFMCTKGHILDIIPASIHFRIRKTGSYDCPECKLIDYRNSIVKTQEEFEQEVLEKYPNNDYTVTSKYINNKTDVMMKHNICGHEFPVNPKNFLFKNNGCPKCSKNKKKTHEQFVEEVKELVGDEYTVITKYKRNDVKLKMKHNICNHEFPVTPTNFLHGQTRCPKCSSIVRESKGVKRIKKYLNDRNIKFKQEVKFKKLRYFSERSNRYHNYPFDFYVYTNNKFFLIEFDGHQHEKGWNGNKEDMLKNKQNDELKNNFCKDHNIDLLRISYKDERRIEKIIDDFIKDNKISVKFND